MVSQIIVTLRNPDRAPALANQFEDLFGHRSRSWQEREAGNLQVFSVLRISAGITVSLIILLAGVLIFNTLTMTVLDKVREIAILRSMGYRKLGHHGNLRLPGVPDRPAGLAARRGVRSDHHPTFSRKSRSRCAAFFTPTTSSWRGVRSTITTRR